ncbi:hypothetical protein DFA_08166 [Cavenderia fasciculata]|uniref:Secreted protein n=1 Tax=Cavenderia fasciculata TaxID=261658 RepID=F4Q5C3_CACFS|nr:uncharacterized protein DFA_08166 [Cavenderia fasciculata]EGG17182.1 hypothetical protein DFA_08166 [Cavenderia fasciculata]|eukprot:XP_004355666.1 hypothetical protein DFA_08166 [Cavenderia fasciculata]
MKFTNNLMIIISTMVMMIVYNSVDGASYVSIQEFPDNNCTGEYFAQNYAIVGTCFERSMYTCDGVSSTRNLYKTDDCSGSPWQSQSYNIGQCTGFPELDQVGYTIWECVDNYTIPANSSNSITYLGSCETPWNENPVLWINALKNNHCFPQTGVPPGSGMVRCKNNKGLMDFSYPQRGCKGQASTDYEPNPKYCDGDLGYDFVCSH